MSKSISTIDSDDNKHEILLKSILKRINLLNLRVNILNLRRKLTILII